MRSKNSFLFLFMAIFLLGCSAEKNTPPTGRERDTSTEIGAFDFPDAHEQPPDGWSGPIFHLSQAYPDQMPPAENFPWLSIDFRTNPEGYMRSVLNYVYEGNIDADWTISNNTVRRWYHAPWMHWDDGGREFIHGLTHERSSRPRELAPTQTSTFQNWAVGFYNPQGGYVMGQVWKDPSSPDVSKAVFPEGTVSAKLLFTEATAAEVPFLEGAYEWQANIWTSSSDHAREPRMLRLLQLDVAIKDSRADGLTGWLFGTFIYQSTAAGASPFEKMIPVGLMWGNDPGVTPEMIAAGTKLAETWINPDLHLSHYGWAGRLNGPVDNPISSCLSCHSTAQIPSSSPMTFQGESDPQNRLRWFRNIESGKPFDEQAISADYSLQIALGILNFLRAERQPEEIPGNPAAHGESTVSEGNVYVVIDGRKYFPISRE